MPCRGRDPSVDVAASARRARTQQDELKAIRYNVREAIGGSGARRPGSPGGYQVERRVNSHAVDDFLGPLGRRSHRHDPAVPAVGVEGAPRAQVEHRDIPVDPQRQQRVVEQVRDHVVPGEPSHRADARRTSPRDGFRRRQPRRIARGENVRYALDPQVSVDRQAAERVAFHRERRSGRSPACPRSRQWCRRRYAHPCRASRPLHQPPRCNAGAMLDPQSIERLADHRYCRVTHRRADMRGVIGQDDARPGAGRPRPTEGGPASRRRSRRRSNPRRRRAPLPARPQPDCPPGRRCDDQAGSPRRTCRR